MDKINRLRAMALEALREYEVSLNAGGEPKYPDWADDMLDVCEQAEANCRPRGEQRPVQPASPLLV